MHAERPGRTIPATGLVHEAFLKMVAIDNVDWSHRAHFFAVAAQIMRRILLEEARKRATDKRGGGWQRIDLSESPDLAGHHDRQLIALDDALKTLAKADPRKAQVIELRFFGGLSIEETAAVLQISPESVKRDFRLARAWLRVELEPAG